jgi:epoxyqueuosine reductase
LQFYITSLAGNCQKHLDVWRRQHACRAFRPFDDAQLGSIEMFTKSGVEEFFGATHAVQIEMDGLDRLPAEYDFVWFGQCVGRTLDMSGMAGGMQQGPRQRGFAGAKVAVQMQRHARLHHPRQRRAQGSGAGFILQIGFKVLHPAIGPKMAASVSPILTISLILQVIVQDNSDIDLAALAVTLKAWGKELGFADLRIAGVDLTDAEPGLNAWLAAGCHGDMNYMAAHGMRRARPAELVPGTLRVISARMNYLPRGADDEWREQEERRLQDPAAAVVSIYARGRDYHKVLRARLQQLADRIEQEAGPFGYRVFTDSAPVMEVALAQKSGLGWRGKNTLLLNREAGSMFFLGELFTDLPLPVDEQVGEHCGQCKACIDVCPTQAITGPYKLDARRCISYLTIELKGSIPLELRPLIGNRVLGCDDCQTVCPWNKFAQRAALPDFDVRNGLDRATLVELFGWSEEQFNRNFEGSPIRRIGHERWLRNIAVGLGNAASAAKGEPSMIAALQARAAHHSELVREHVAWALARHGR